VGGSSFSEYLAVLDPIVFIHYISIQSMIDHEGEDEEEADEK
jgi:hypothetical protein